MTRYIVEGRRFRRHLHAVTFAQRIAEEMGRAVEIHADQVQHVEQCERKWLATLHPDNSKQVVGFRTPKAQPVAVAG